jgi:hypothetical protein
VSIVFIAVVMVIGGPGKAVCPFGKTVGPPGDGIISPPGNRTIVVVVISLGPGKLTIVVVVPGESAPKTVICI